jgi:hypothetical protein
MIMNKRAAKKYAKEIGGDRVLIRSNMQWRSSMFDQDQPKCQIYEWRGIGDEIILGSGKSWIAAFDDAGIDLDEEHRFTSRANFFLCIGGDLGGKTVHKRKLLNTRYYYLNHFHVGSTEKGVYIYNGNTMNEEEREEAAFEYFDKIRKKMK